MLVKSLKIQKEKYSTIQEIGTSNAKFYGYLILNGHRMGTVWKFNDGKYVFNEDFDRKVHSQFKRTSQVKGLTLSELKENVEDFYWNWW